MILIPVLPGILCMAFFTVNIVNLSLILNMTLLIIISGTAGIMRSDFVWFLHRVIGCPGFIVLG